MAIDIQVPSVGESITEGIVSRWLKPDGATVREDEPLLELETDKATTEIPAPASGQLRITVPEGETVAIGAVVGTIDPAPAAEKPAARPPKRAAEADAASPASSTAPPLSPAARRLAAAKNIDVRRLADSGQGGRITKEDVLAYLERSQPKADQPEPAKPEPERTPAPAPWTPPPPGLDAETRSPAETSPRETRQRMTGIRQRIAERLVAAQHTTATLTTFNEIDMSAVIDWRQRHKQRFQDQHGVALGFMSFFVRASIEALKAFPLVNARIDGPDIVQHHYYHIGVAVSTERGLLVPVLRDADRLNFAAIERTLAELAAKARQGKISVDDLQGGTFTITNGGIFGSLLSTPILNTPQTGILGMHAIHKRPVVVQDRIVIRPMMYVALSYDHRLIDGREAVLFLVRIKECIENPERLLLEI
ncbi:MAG: 2-oxoglutarate dehydrogenase complex dihydrolipoyllysine-residue succinyltransferase [Gemmataceae bacterium]